MVNFDKLSNIYICIHFGILQIRRDGERCISIDHVLSILHESVNDLFQFLSNNAIYQHLHCIRESRFLHDSQYPKNLSYFFLLYVPAIKKQLYNIFML